MENNSARFLRRLGALLSALVLMMAASAPPVAAQSKAGEDVPFVRTPPAVVDAMLKLAEVKGSDFVIDLGCGDGRIVVAAAQKFKARGRGVDFNPKRISAASVGNGESVPPVS